MTKLAAILDSLFKIRPDEARRTSLAFLYLFTAIGAFIIGRIARTVLFLEIPGYRDQLPLVYVLIAASVSTVMFGYARVERKLRRDQTNMITLAALITVTLALRLALKSGNHSWYWVFYVWVELLGSFLIVQFWTLMNEIFHSRQAKRLFAIIGGGGVLSNIFIGFGISSSVKTLGTENLLYVQCGLLGISLLAVYLLGRDARVELTAARERSPTKSKSKVSAAGKVFQTRHVKLIATVVVLTYLVSTLVDYQFQVIIGDSIPGKDARSAFFGTFFGVTGILAGLIQFFLTSRILERFGVLFALLLLPAAMLTGSAGLLMVPLISGLVAVSLTKGSENVLRYTVNDSTLQLLYLPVPTHIRGRAKAWIDGILKPLSIGGAGILLGVLVGQLEKLTGLSLGFSVGVYQLSWLVGGALFLWLVALVRLRREYLASLLSTLQQRRLNFADAKFQINDEATVRTLERSLASDKMGEVLHALELLPFVAGKARGGLYAKVGELLRHPADEVRVAALGFLGRSGTHLQADLVGDLLDDASAAVRSAATLAYCAIARERAIARVHPLLEDVAPQVRAAATAGLIRSCGLDGVLACADTLKTMLSSSRAAERERAAWVLGEVGVQNFYQPLVPLFSDAHKTVRHAAIVAAGRMKSSDLVSHLVMQLADSRLASAATAALAAYGPGISEVVSNILDDREKPATVRAQACRVLARLGDSAGVAILVAHLRDESSAVRSAAVLALTNIVHHSPSVRLDRKTVALALRTECEHAFKLLALGEDLAIDDAVVLLRDAMRYRQEQAMSRIFGLMGLLYPPSTIELVSRNVQSSQAATRANAVEVLDNLLEKEDKAFILPLFDDSPAARRLQAGAEVFSLRRTDRTSRLVELLESDDDWLRICAATAAAAWKVSAVVDKVRALLDSENPVCRETAILALRTLEADGGNKLKQRLETLREDPARSVSRYAVHVLAELG